MRTRQTKTFYLESSEQLYTDCQMFCTFLAAQTCILLTAPWRPGQERQDCKDAECPTSHGISNSLPPFLFPEKMPSWKCSASGRQPRGTPTRWGGSCDFRCPPCGTEMQPAQQHNQHIKVRVEEGRGKDGGVGPCLSRVLLMGSQLPACGSGHVNGSGVQRWWRRAPV